jgi:hypothetical protein
MKPRLTIEPVYHDTDLVEVRVSASSETFSGAVCVYVSTGELAAAAKELQGFPAGPTDKRRLAWGAEESTSGGRAELTFHCIDIAAHPAVQVVLRSGDQCHDTPGQAVTLTIRLEPAAIDRFVATLAVLEARQQTDIAVLDGVP